MTASAINALSGPGSVTFDSPTQAVTAASFSTPGAYILQVAVSDGALSATQNVNVTVEPPTVLTTQNWIASPLDGATITEPVAVSLIPGITLTSGQLKIYPVSDANAVTLISASTVGSGPVGTLDPTLLANGPYWVELRGTNSLGVTQTNLASITIGGEYKPGRVTATVTDLVVPVAGLPIEIQRRYDSLERNIKSDFGYGWSLGIRLRMETAPSGHVTFTLGGQRRTFYLTPVTNPEFVYWATPAYTPETGLRGRLDTLGDNCNGVLQRAGNLWRCGVSSEGASYQPSGYRYTDSFGRVYTLSATGDLVSARDANGNVLNVTSTGITSSTGVAVTFSRDGEGRITQINDPLARAYVYQYNADGTLATVNWPSVATPLRYTYSNRLLTGESDRRGRNVNASVYDANDRPAGDTFDGNGNQITTTGVSYAYDFENRLKSVNGGAVRLVYDGDGNLVGRISGGVTTSYLVARAGPRRTLIATKASASIAILGCTICGRAFISRTRGGS